MTSKKEIYTWLQHIPDPEVPVLNVLDLGIIRDIIITANEVEIIITPTYSGCPAMHTFATTIQMEAKSRGIEHIKITEVLSPAWTTDWMSEAGKQKLKDYGIAPPQYSVKDNAENNAKVPCPQCNSLDTYAISMFGSTACKALYKCNTCLETFDYFKCH